MAGASASWRGSLSEQIELAAFWFALNFHWGALLTVLLPTDILRFVPDAAKGQTLAQVAAAGAFLAMVTQPVAGALSDRLVSRWGKRRPFVAAGTVINLVGLWGLMTAPSLRAYLLAFLAVQLGNNVAGAAYQGYLPDLVPATLRGAASGYMGLMTMLGTILALALAGLLVQPGQTAPLYLVVMAVLATGAVITLWRVPEAPPSRAAPAWRQFWQGFGMALRNADFLWLFLTRALVMFAFYLLLNFLEYFLKDVLHLAHYVQATTTVGGVVMLGATISSIAAGVFSDRWGRRALVALSGWLMALTGIVFAILPVWPVVLAVSLLFGLGYGAYISVDWALAVDVLPSAWDRARDLGIWSVAITLPQVVAPLVGGLALAWGGSAWGYRLLFVLAVAFAASGSAFVWRIRAAR